MYRYPYQELEFAGFKAARAVCLLLVLFFGLFQVFQWAYGVFDQKTMYLINTCWAVLFGVCLYYLLTKIIDTDFVSRQVNKKAGYESALYTTLTAVCKLEGGLKTPPLEAYVKPLLDYRGDHEAHLQNLPPDVAKAVFEVCQGLIEQEKVLLAQKLQGEIGGASIEGHGNYILRLETMADCVRQLPKISAYDMPSLLFPDATGEMAEVK